jgi:amino acid adenylation domain-containing protein
LQIDTSALDKPFALLAAQQAIWVADRASGQATAAFLSAQVTALPAGIDPSQFVEACRVAVRHTEMLRLRLTGLSTQVVSAADPGDIQIPIIDLSAESDPAAAAECWMTAARHARIDPTASPAFAWALLALAPDRLLWSQIYHHAVSDWNGRQMVVARVAAIYDALSQGLPPPEAAAAPNLAGLVAEEAAYFATSRYKDDAAWCLEQCRYRPASMSMSGRSTVLTQFSRRANRCIDQMRTQALQAAAARLNVSLAQLLCAAWAALLGRLSGQADLLVGFQVAARRPAARDVPAMTTNQMPLRLAVNPDGRFADLATLTARQCRAALRHQHYPHMHLRRALGLTPADPDLFEVGFNFLPLPAPVTIGGASLETRNLSHGPVRDLMLAVETGPDGGLILDLDANRDRYGADDIERLMDRLVLVLAALATTADAIADLRIADLRVMTSAEHEQVTTVFSASGPAPPRTTLAAMLAARFAATPGAPALEVAGATLTCLTLGAHANRLARHLIAHGLGPGDVAAIALPRGEELIVTVVACMLAGIAICPLDAAHPPERQGFMLGDSGAKAIIGLEAGRNGPHTLPLLAIDAAETRAAVAKLSGEPLAEAERPAPVTGETIAYVAFTSGSTGRPKGVAVDHASIAQLVDALQMHFPVGLGDAVICTTTLTFDVAMSDLFLALTSGAVLVLLREHEMRDPAAIRDAIRAHPSPLLQATPSVWRSLPIEQMPTSLRAVLGGEAFPIDLLPRLRRLAGVFNEYGPTETTVWATVHRVAGQDGIDRAVPVGRPIAGYRIWILDKLNQPLPIDGIGELCIGGPSVTAGYLGQPALTAAAFVACPFGGGRMYRTGDLARWRADGAIELLGRRDGQVKIAGHRIELAEIEHAMLAQDWVAEAAVLAHGETGRQRLVAFAVPRPGAAAPDVATLRGALAVRLPAWMQPSALVTLAVMPHTTSGKIDRQALRALAATTVQAPAPTVPASPATPASPLVGLLQRAFGRATNRTDVAPDADFFEIGGDSLGAMVLLTELAQAGCEVPLPLLLECRTPAAIAAALAAPRPPPPRAAQPTVFVFPGMGGDSPDLAGFRADCARDIRFELLDYPDWPALLVPGFGMADFATYFVGRIQQMAPVGQVFVAGYSLGAVIAIAVASALREAGREVGGLLLFDLRTIEPPDPSGQQDGGLPPAPGLVRDVATSLRDGDPSRAFGILFGRLLADRPRLLRQVTALRGQTLPPRFRHRLRLQISVMLQTRVVEAWRESGLANPMSLSGVPTVLFRTTVAPSALADDPGWQRQGVNLRVIDVTGSHLSMLRERGAGSLHDLTPPVVSDLIRIADERRFTGELADAERAAAPSPA